MAKIALAMSSWWGDQQTKKAITTTTTSLTTYHSLYDYDDDDDVDDGDYDDIIAEQNLLKFLSWVITFLHQRPFGGDLAITEKCIACTASSSSIPSFKSFLDKSLIWHV